MSSGRGEIADAYRGSAMAEQLGLWPLTLNSVTSGHNVVARLNGVGGYASLTEAAAPIWAQGFMNVQLASTASTAGRATACHPGRRASRSSGA